VFKLRRKSLIRTRAICDTVIKWSDLTSYRTKNKHQSSSYWTI